MNQTVAIVGTHPNTREKAPWNDKNIDVWVFNNQILQGWCPRADACFDMHQPDDIYRRSLEHPAFGIWLKDKKALSYYTPSPVADCPDNVIYPLDEIVNRFLSKFKRGEEINKYFTSGPCYAIALAIHLGYKRIEMYGIEMESNAEYVYQRDGVGLWFGIALGLGIEIKLLPETQMFYAPLYGYISDATTVDREAFETRATELAESLDRTKTEFDNAKGKLDSCLLRISSLKDAGASAEEMMEIGKEYEDAQHAYEQAIANHAFVNGQYIDTQAWKMRIDKAMEYAGKAHEVLAQNDEKWMRVADKLELAEKREKQ